MSPELYKSYVSKRVAYCMGAIFLLWALATLFADRLVVPIQQAVQWFERLFGLHLVS